jgi:hypothetical protein
VESILKRVRNHVNKLLVLLDVNCIQQSVSMLIVCVCAILILRFPNVLVGNFLPTDVLSELHCILMCIE